MSQNQMHSLSVWGDRHKFNRKDFFSSTKGSRNNSIRKYKRKKNHKIKQKG